ncbi:MAG: Ig-like domain-containing protein, partial [Dehalococcoidales bacterium]
MKRKQIRFINYFVIGLISLSLALGACAPKPQLSSIIIESAQPGIFQLGTTQQFTATGTYSDQSTKDITSNVTWKSSDSTVATVSNKGLVTAVALGTVNITASLSGISSTATTLPVVTISYITIEQKSPYKLLVKANQQFTCLATFSDGSQEDATLLSTWNSSAPTVATITTIGAATGNAAGNTNITASLYGVTSAPLNLIVTVPSSGPTISSIAVTRKIVSNLTVGYTQQFTATAISTDGSTADITSQATWASSDQSVATVSSTGVVTGIAPGQADITAFYSGVTSPAISLTVVSP